MSFRETMDRIWGSGYLRLLFLLLYVFLYIGSELSLISEVYLLYGLIPLGAVFIYYLIFSSTINKGHKDIVKTFYPEKEVFNPTSCFEVIGIIVLLGLIYLAVKTDDYQGVAMVFIVIICVAFFLSSLFSWFDDDESTITNEFFSIVVTKSEFIVYMKRPEVTKFDRSALQYSISYSQELILIDNLWNPQKKLLVNIEKLTSNDKLELRSLLAEQSENLNKD